MVLTHLFGLFGQVRPLDVRHLQAVLEMQGLHSGPGCATAASRQEHLSAFRHLRGVYETVRAVEHLLSPMLNGDRSNLPQSRDISTELARLLNELDLHGRIPRHFRSGTFENLARLRSRVAHFLSERQTSPDAALQSLRDGTREVLDSTVADILADIDRALSEAL